MGKRGAEIPVGFVPCRAGSKRIPFKNIRPLGGHPLLAYSVTAAIESGVFAKVVCSTDSILIADIARYYGADVIMRPGEMATGSSPDIEWLRHALETLSWNYRAYGIVRATSPFRKADAIRRAWRMFEAEQVADSLRAVERVSQHPMKMWVVRWNRLHPLIPFGPEKQPWHSSQTATLPEVFVQNASLEIAWTTCVEDYGTIAGETIMPFFTSPEEGFDLNTMEDWRTAEQMVVDNPALLPRIEKQPWRFNPGDLPGVEMTEETQYLA
jgi:CMP-N-acetylneuraminic acid synthetase